MSLDSYIKKPVVEQLVGLSGPTIYRLEKEGKFPARRKVGKRAVAWLQSEVIDWQKSREMSLHIQGGV